MQNFPEKSERDVWICITESDGISGSEIAKKLDKFHQAVSRSLNGLLKKDFVKYEYKDTNKKGSPLKLFYPTVRGTFKQIFPNITEKELEVIDNFFFKTKFKNDYIKVLKSKNITPDSVGMVYGLNIILNPNTIKKITTDRREKKIYEEYGKVIKKHTKLPKEFQKLLSKT